MVTAAALPCPTHEPWTAVVARCTRQSVVFAVGASLRYRRMSNGHTTPKTGTITVTRTRTSGSETRVSVLQRRFHMVLPLPTDSHLG